MTVMNQKGFTLLESLTVLMIGSIMLSLLFAALPPVYEKRVVQHFVSQLEEDLLYAQQTALVRHATVKVQFDFAGCRYIIKHADEGSSPKLVRTYSCHIVFKKATLKRTLTFNPSGVPNQGGKIVIDTQHTSFALTIYLGSGKINVQKK